MQRFWSKVDVRDVDDCWEWLGGKTRGGYGEFFFEGSVRRAHRVAWMLEKGEIPEGSLILHSCDNPACVNPAHLSIGSHVDNAADMVARGRACVGEKQGSSRLTEKSVGEIRRRYAAGGVTIRELAAEHGVAEMTVSDVIHRRTWLHV